MLGGNYRLLSAIEAVAQPFHNTSHSIMLTSSKSSEF